MGAEIQVDNFTITNLEIHTRNEMAAKWGRGGGRIGKIGGMGTVDN